MDATVDPALFVNFIPLNALRPESQQQLARKSVMREARAGEYLFKCGDPAEAAMFLVSGQVQLEDGGGKPLAVVRAGEPGSFHRLAHQSPRKVSARCLRDTRYLLVDAGLLDVMLTWDQSGRFEVGELSAGVANHDGDWMTRLLQKLALLDRGKTYIAVCDTGRRSSVAVFVLSEKGYDAYVLEGGLPAKL